ncbi:molecular chaperone DnaJ [Gluconobacter oxydans]|uniref:Molecular chaperone DnaJ n=1 Tax=Gluconobacter thailandicus NBRC 3257 TaxID=1381097 RepID=A0ABQ0IS97_GLUTH|nr:J domain-containing protein [Gluconobacter thailandicus]AFW02030.1 DnaJ family protein [Gluconobacter oxydans H24]ANQ42402.1 molecular chaperone DnaJ [Gluconobacter oxydans]KXV34387.1 molecular chaperone DnaJ [Gluconobacter thailandicus]KXV53248.1 molecular chaperone DnaJ [Gluconobacter thailandicus]GAC86895.1 molecular chaperone DnaJ [Gluconobacter thailandicus NBRC 3255]
MQRKSTRHRAFDPDPEAPDQTCDHPGCMERAGYRAPRGREALRSYFWFCLDHVREYNSRWDFYRGMTPGQIEAHLRADTSWQRPSWKLGTGTANKAEFNEEDILDPLDILGASRRNRAERAKETARQRAAASGPPEPLRQPLATLDLSWPVSLDEVKTRYRALARRHHPDANIGDQKAEERFKAIGSAYAVLKTHFSRESEFVS